jgi:hypothetical protein
MILLLLALTACGTAVDHGDGTSGIAGRVTIGPQCPVVMVGSPCPDAPFAAVITVRDAGGDPVAHVETGADGGFRIPLAPGTYAISAEPLASGGIARMQPLPPVVVRPGAFRSVDLSFDSGIR